MSNKGQSGMRASFSGKIGYVLAVAGSAVGLGNIWRFPYLAAKYGGGIFLLVYLILTVTFGYVLIMSETALGRMTRKSPVGAYQTFGKTKSFKIGGWLSDVLQLLLVPYCRLRSWRLYDPVWRTVIIQSGHFGVHPQCTRWQDRGRFMLSPGIIQDDIR